MGEVLPFDRDARARERIESSLDESLLVEAAAGTGKTTQLVARLVNVLREGRTTVDRVVAVTFTRKAAGEMKLRLRQRLDEARAAAEDAAEEGRLVAAIERLEEAHVGTIHSFCAEILRERPVEAGIDPGFTELDEDDAAALYEREFRGWVERRLNEMPPGLRRALSRLSVRPAFGGGAPLDSICAAGRALAEWRDFPCPWRREPFDRQRRIDELVAWVLELDEMAAGARKKDYLRLALEPVTALAEWLRRTQAAQRSRDDDAVEARLILEALRGLQRDRRKGSGASFAAGVPRSEALARRSELLERLEAFRRAADADLAAELKGELDEVTEAYEEAKRRAGRLDFLDLLLEARTLVRSRPEVRAHLQQRFTHLFVDEFQDTDPLQAELLLLLAADDPAVDDWRRARPAAGKLFLVGDPKQSIYRFRRADVVLYQEIQERLRAAGVGVVHLTRSFRSVRPIQQAVNAVFSEAIREDRESGQPGYVPLAEHRPAPADQPSVVVLPVPRPYGPWGKVTDRAIEESLPDAVAAWVHWLIEESGWTVEEDGGRREPVAPRHVCVQFRRFASWKGDVTAAYVRAFEDRGVPHLLVGGRSLHRREEVETLRTALVAVEWPDDELSVFAALKGSLFAVPDDLLLRFRLEVGSLHPFRPAAADEDGAFAPIRDALRVLADLHRRRNRIPVAATLNRLLEASRAHAGFAVRPAGHQVLANVQQVVDLARRFERRGGISFRGFVDRLVAEAEQPASRPAPPIEEGAEGVRLMTVHSAKGLEFPVVVLADPTAKLSRKMPDGSLDAGRGLAARRLLGWSPWDLLDAAETEAERDRAEGIRVAYVAATRARDLLVVPAVGHEMYERGWLAALNPALYPVDYRAAGRGPGCPRFGSASVLDLPQERDREGEVSVRPGLHRPAVGGHQVVWWDPASLRLRVESTFGLLQEQILAEDADRSTADAGLRRYLAWRRERERVLARGAEPSRRVERVTEIERPPPGEPVDLRVECLPRAAGRPRGRRFGTLVHSVLRDTDLGASESELADLVRFHARVLEASPSELDACRQAVAAALAHPRVARAASAREMRRESPFLLHVDEAVVEGVLDLVYRDASGWTVVDFKTDLEGPEAPERYRRQLAWYVTALARLTGEPARGVLLGV